MQFQNLGTVSDIVKSKSMNAKWQEQKKNSFKVVPDDKVITQLKKQTNDINRQQTLSSIEGKMKAGLRLSPSEMEYLRKNNPELYKKAVMIEKERDGYCRELERCRTKEDVSRLNMQKLSLLSSEAKAVSNNSNISSDKKQEALEFIAMRIAAISNEHARFLESPEYKRLPSDKDDDKKKKPAKTKAIINENTGYIYNSKGGHNPASKPKSKISIDA